MILFTGIFLKKMYAKMSLLTLLATSFVLSKQILFADATSGNKIEANGQIVSPIRTVNSNSGFLPIHYSTDDVEAIEEALSSLPQMTSQPNHLSLPPFGRWLLVENPFVDSVETKRAAQSFTPWAGKRSVEEGKRVFHSWAGKRSNKPFSNWAGKRDYEESQVN